MSTEAELKSLCEALLFELATEKKMRIVKCKSCGREFFAPPSRGEMRTYCDDACRVYDKKYPGKYHLRREPALFLDPCNVALDMLKKYK